MQCANCGANIVAGKRFCADCGAPVEDPELTRLARTPPSRLPATADDLDEQIIFVARPTLLFVKAGYALAALGSILLAVLFAWLLPWVPWYIWLPLSLVLLLLPAYRHLKRNLVRYTLTESKIEIDEGLIARTTRNIPLTKVQDVTVTASLTQRLLGYGNLVIDNASEIGGEIVLRDIHAPREHADKLLRQLRKF